MINERIEIWKKEEYHYPAAHGFIPVMFSYIHEDEKKHPAMIIAPGAHTGKYPHRKRTCRQWNSMVQGTMYSFWNIRLIS